MVLPVVVGAAVVGGPRFGGAVSALAAVGADPAISTTRTRLVRVRTGRERGRLNGLALSQADEPVTVQVRRGSSDAG